MSSATKMPAIKFCSMTEHALVVDGFASWCDRCGRSPTEILRARKEGVPEVRDDMIPIGRWATLYLTYFRLESNEHCAIVAAEDQHGPIEKPREWTWTICNDATQIVQGKISSVIDGIDRGAELARFAAEMIMSKLDASQPAKKRG